MDALVGSGCQYASRVAERGGRLVQAWEKERREWRRRPNLWKLYLVNTVNLGVQVGLAVDRDSPHFATACAVGLVVSGALTTLAYRARPGRELRSVWRRRPHACVR